MSDNLNDKEKNFENLVKFYETDMELKKSLLEYAPNEEMNFNEESRIEYIDDLYKSLRWLESEFISMTSDLVPNSKDIIKNFFEKTREKFMIGNYDYETIQKIYKENFADINPQLIEDVKKEFIGYRYNKDLETIAGEAKSINELLHVFHSYVSNDENVLQSLPVIDVKENSFGYPITLYGQETEISKKIFDSIPKDLRMGWTEIVSMPNKTLMMVRDRGHALTMDIDSSNEKDIEVSYFIPSLCNEEMIENLPGINKSSITDYGATGFMVTPKSDIGTSIVDFIGKVPMDSDRPIISKSKKSTNIIEDSVDFAER